MAPSANGHGNGNDQTPNPQMQSYAPSTRAVHADDYLSLTTDVAPPIHVSTTFEHSRNPAELVPSTDEDTSKDENTAVEAHVYSRISAPSTTRLETVMSSICNGKAISYSSGLSAFHALLTYFNPKVVAIGAGYYGCHGVLDIHMKLTGAKKVDLFNEKSWDAAGLSEGDVVHLETPLNPSGEAYNIKEFAEKAHARGAYLSVDATLGPPTLLDPLKHGADIVMHSGTKYIGGHSDMLCGILVVPKHRHDWWKGLWSERIFLGSVMGSFEGWLGMRSVRTLDLRVQRQSSNAEKLAKWIDDALNHRNEDSELVQKVVQRVQHASLQKDDMHWIKEQMPNGFGPLFALWMKDQDLARTFPSTLQIFHHATSLGGVESLIEWRHLADRSTDARLLRVSVGVEAPEDLIDDFRAGFKALASSS